MDSLFRERRQGKGRRHYKKREQRGISGELRGIQSNIQRNRGNSIFNRSGKIFTILCPRVRNKADAVRKREAREEAKEGVEIGNFRINILLVILGEEDDTRIREKKLELYGEKEKGTTEVWKAEGRLSQNSHQRRVLRGV